MFNILIICGATFPPQHGIGGLRPAYFAKHLFQYGWNVHIATRDYHPSHQLYNPRIEMSLGLPLDNISRTLLDKNTEEKYYKRNDSINYFFDILLAERESFVPIISQFEKDVFKLIKERRFDLILSSSPDLFALRLAWKINKLTKIPYIADFRDISEQALGLNLTFTARLRRYREIFRLCL